MITPTVNSNHQQLVQKANEFVNQAFYGTLLRNFRDAQKPTLLDQGPGATTFIRQLDNELIKRMSQQGESPVAKALIKKLERHGRQNVVQLQNAEKSSHLTGVRP
jgi:hypothetical protein